MFSVEISCAQAITHMCKVEFLFYCHRTKFQINGFYTCLENPAVGQLPFIASCFSFSVLICVTGVIIVFKDYTDFQCYHLEKTANIQLQQSQI